MDCMTRDIEDRLAMFIGDPGAFELHRIALNMDQIRKFNPPPNPAKFTDSRCSNYVAQYGRSSWELDALEPTVIARLVRDNVENVILDKKRFAARIKEQERGRKTLGKISKNWKKIESSL